VDVSHRQVEQIRRLAGFKQGPSGAASPLGPEVVDFFRNSVAGRQTKFVRLAEAWQALVPPLLAEHCAFDSFSRGTLTVLVDSASHLYDLKQLLLAGLQRQLLIACRSAGLRKIVLRPGRWYEGNRAAEGKPRFD